MDNGSTWKRVFFGVVFSVLTILCWCPIGYGAYGVVSRIWGMPNWAVTALSIGVVMFVLEAIYLFATDLTLDDEQLPSVIKSIREDIQ